MILVLISIGGLTLLFCFGFYLSIMQLRKAELATLNRRSNIIERHRSETYGLRQQISNLNAKYEFEYAELESQRRNLLEREKNIAEEKMLAQIRQENYYFSQKTEREYLNKTLTSLENIRMKIRRSYPNHWILDVFSDIDRLVLDSTYIVDVLEVDMQNHKLDKPRIKYLFGNPKFMSLIKRLRDIHSDLPRRTEESLVKDQKEQQEMIDELNDIISVLKNAINERL